MELRSVLARIAGALLAGPVSSALWAGDVAGTPGPVVFDAEILRQRGLSSETGSYFSRAPRFPPGRQIVNLIVNGSAIGKQYADFDQDGNLCLSSRLADRMGISIATTDGPAPDDCLNTSSALARLQIDLKPSLGTVEITAPPDMLPNSMPEGKFLHGGAGAMLNYHGYALNSDVGSIKSPGYRYLETEAGFNMDDWLFRSRQNLTRTGGLQHASWGTAFIQKTFSGPDKIFQAGRINLSNPLYMGVPLWGAQWFAEQSLRRSRNIPINGSAFGRSRVELRQNGILLYTTFVPGGPFSVTDYPLQTASSDLEVRVIDDSGGQQTIIVPSSSLMLAENKDLADGLSLAAGQTWNQSQIAAYDAQPLLASSYGFSPAPGVGNTLSLLYAENYRSIGTAVRWRASTRTSIFGQLLAAGDGRNNLHGMNGAAGWSMTGAFADLGLSTNVRTRDFRTIMDAVNSRIGPYAYQGARAQVGLTLSMTDTYLHGLSASITRQDYFAGGSNFIYSVGWGGNLSGATVEIGIARNTTGTIGQQNTVPSSGNGNNYAYINLSFPLGGRARSNSYIRSNADRRYAGTSVEQNINQVLSYRATVERQSADDGGDSTNSTLSASVDARYLSLSAGTSRGTQVSSRFAELSGGLVATPQGVGFSAVPTQDSYGLIKLGDVPGIRVDTPQGPAWSGPFGLAAIAGLLPFRDSRLEVAVASVPPDVDIDNGLAVLAAARGAVVHLDMGVHRVHRVLLSVKGPDGAPLAYGLAVLGNGEFVTTVGSRGRVLVKLSDEPVVWKVLLPDGSSCTLGAMASAPKAAADFFELGSATCDEP